MPVDIFRDHDRLIHQHPQCDECAEHSQHVQTVADGISSDERYKERGWDTDGNHPCNAGIDRQKECCKYQDKPKEDI